jgi:hypothetical protein
MTRARTITYASALDDEFNNEFDDELDPEHSDVMSPALSNDSAG